MRSEAGTYLSITFPLVTGGEEQPRLIRAVPQRADTQRIVREREDFLFMLIEPRNPLSEGDFVPLPGDMGTDTDFESVSVPISFFRRASF
jgi:hypothetical protein